MLASYADIRRAASIISGGGVVIFPTETVYGLGTHVFNEKAVARIFELKARPSFNPLIVHIASLEELELVASDIPDEAYNLCSQFWPGPLTLVLKKAPKLPDIVTAGLPTVGVRMPAHPVAAGLLKESRVPIAAPSANPFGSLSPTCCDHITNTLKADVDMVLDGGPCKIGIESTIVALIKSHPPQLLRFGGLPIEEIKKLLPNLITSPPLYSSSKPLSPGMMKKHYSPKTPMLLVSMKALSLPENKKIGLLSLKAPQFPERFAHIEVLSPTGNLAEAATNLFPALHRLDSLSLDQIMACLVPEEGLGIAINDRLRRACEVT